VVEARYRTGTSEKSAQRHGIDFRTFTDLRSAEAWLLSEPVGPR